MVEKDKEPEKEVRDSGGHGVTKDTTDDQVKEAAGSGNPNDQLQLLIEKMPQLFIKDPDTGKKTLVTFANEEAKEKYEQEHKDIIIQTTNSDEFLEWNGLYKRIGPDKYGAEKVLEEGETFVDDQLKGFYSMHPDLYLEHHNEEDTEKNLYLYFNFDNASLNDPDANYIEYKKLIDIPSYARTYEQKLEIKARLSLDKAYRDGRYSKGNGAQMFSHKFQLTGMETWESSPMRDPRTGKAYVPGNPGGTRSQQPAYQEDMYVRTYDEDYHFGDVNMGDFSQMTDIFKHFDESGEEREERLFRGYKKETTTFTNIYGFKVDPLIQNPKTGLMEVNPEYIIEHVRQGDKWLPDKQIWVKDQLNTSYNKLNDPLVVDERFGTSNIYLNNGFWYKIDKKKPEQWFERTILEPKITLTANGQMNFTMGVRKERRMKTRLEALKEAVAHFDPFIIKPKDFKKIATDSLGFIGTHVRRMFDATLSFLPQDQRDKIWNKTWAPVKFVGDQIGKAFKKMRPVINVMLRFAMDPEGTFLGLMVSPFMSKEQMALFGLTPPAELDDDYTAEDMIMDFILGHTVGKAVGKGLSSTVAADFKIATKSIGEKLTLSNIAKGIHPKLGAMEYNIRVTLANGKEKVVKVIRSCWGGRVSHGIRPPRRGRGEAGSVKNARYTGTFARLNEKYPPKDGSYRGADYFAETTKLDFNDGRGPPLFKVDQRGYRDSDFIPEASKTIQPAPGDDSIMEAFEDNIPIGTKASGKLAEDIPEALPQAQISETPSYDDFVRDNPDVNISREEYEEDWFNPETRNIRDEQGVIGFNEARARGETTIETAEEYNRQLVELDERINDGLERAAERDLLKEITYEKYLKYGNAEFPDLPKMTEKQFKEWKRTQVILRPPKEDSVAISPFSRLTDSEMAARRQKFLPLISKDTPRSTLRKFGLPALSENQKKQLLDCIQTKTISEFGLSVLEKSKELFYDMMKKQANDLLERFIRVSGNEYSEDQAKDYWNEDDGGDYDEDYYDDLLHQVDEEDDPDDLDGPGFYHRQYVANVFSEEIPTRDGEAALFDGYGYFFPDDDTKIEERGKVVLYPQMAEQNGKIIDGVITYMPSLIGADEDEGVNGFAYGEVNSLMFENPAIQKYLMDAADRGDKSPILFKKMIADMNYVDKLAQTVTMNGPELDNWRKKLIEKRGMDKDRANRMIHMFQIASMCADPTRFLKDEFHDRIEKYREDGFSEENIASLDELHTIFGDKAITIKELKSKLVQAGYKFDPELLNLINVNKDGKISWNEFYDPVSSSLIDDLINYDSTLFDKQDGYILAEQLGYTKPEDLDEISHYYRYVTHAFNLLEERGIDKTLTNIFMYMSEPPGEEENYSLRRMFKDVYDTGHRRYPPQNIKVQGGNLIYIAELLRNMAGDKWYNAHIHFTEFLERNRGKIPFTGFTTRQRRNVVDPRYEDTAGRHDPFKDSARDIDPEEHSQNVRDLSGLISGNATEGDLYDFIYDYIGDPQTSNYAYYLLKRAIKQLEKELERKRERVFQNFLIDEEEDLLPQPPETAPYPPVDCEDPMIEKEGCGEELEQFYSGMNQPNQFYYGAEMNNFGIF